MTDTGSPAPTASDRATLLIALGLVIVLASVVIADRAGADLEQAVLNGGACAPARAPAPTFESRWPSHETTQPRTRYWLTPGPRGRHAPLASEVLA